jgi:hypothetical protein
MTKVPFPEGAGDFYFRHRVQTVSRTHPAQYAMSTGGSIPGVKRPGREAIHAFPPRAEVKNA